MNFKLITIYFITVMMISCTTSTVKIINEKKGSLKASMRLDINETKEFPLDINTAPKPQYTQLFKDKNGIIYFTFLNDFNNSIYFYNYKTLKFEKKITWNKDDSNGISGLTGYYIKSLDSIYLYNKSKVEIKISNDKGNIRRKISLLNNLTDARNWALKYPQYDLQTVKPFIGTAHDLLLTGFFYGTIPENVLSDFKFTARLNFKANHVSFSNTYPLSLYGSGYNWEGDLFTEVYSDLHPDGNKLILSFPVSHDLYIADLNTGRYKKVYAGSNFASTINSLNKKPKHSSREELLSNIIEQDEYTAVKYDKFNKVYYRFLLKGIHDGKSNNEWKKKPITIIVMDKNFNYLGETVIGTGEEWYWQNSFVTKEGLNIEYNGVKNDENFLTLKVFTLKKI